MNGIKPTQMGYDNGNIPSGKLQFANWNIAI